MASTIRVTRGTSASGTAATSSTVLITRGTARSSGGSTIRITRGTAAAGASTGSKLRITRGTAASHVPTTLGARAGADKRVDALRDLTLDGSGSTGSWVSATWRQVGDSRFPGFNPASPTVALTGSGSVVTYRAPAAHDEYTLTFELSVSSLSSTSIDTRTDTVLPWLRWRLTPTGLAPCGPRMAVTGSTTSTTPTPPPVASTPLLIEQRQYLDGVSRETPSGTTTETWVGAFETAMGSTTDISHYYHTWDNSTFPTTGEKARAADGQYPLIAWQTGRLNGTTPTWAGIAAGSEDTQIDAVAARFKAAPGMFILNYENEPELDTVWQRHGSSTTVSATSLAEHKAAFQRIVTRFRNAGVSNVLFSAVYMGVMTTNKQNQVLAAYPGDAYVDVIGFDPYMRFTSGVWQSFSEMVNPWYQWAQTNLTSDRPYILAEYGVVEDPSLPNRRADWFKGMGDSILAGDFPNLRGFVYFDHTDVTATGEYALGSGAAFTAYKAMIERIRTVPLTGPNVLRQKVPSGYYAHVGSSGTGTSVTLGSGTLRLQPWLVTDPITIDRLGCEVTVAGSAGSLIRLVIYGDNGSGYPGNLVLDAGTVVGDVVATAEITVSQALSAGNIYWVGAALQGTLTVQPTVRTANPPMGGFGIQVGTTAKPGTNETVAGYTMASVTGAAPSTFSTTKALAGSVPRIFFRSA